MTLSVNEFLKIIIKLPIGLETALFYKLDYDKLFLLGYGYV